MYGIYSIHTNINAFFFYYGKVMKCFPLTNSFGCQTDRRHATAL